MTRTPGLSGRSPDMADAWALSHPYGWRARLGVIVPPTNTVNEAEWHRMAPAAPQTRRSENTFLASR